MKKRNFNRLLINWSLVTLAPLCANDNDSEIEIITQWDTAFEKVEPEIIPSILEGSGEIKISKKPSTLPPNYDETIGKQTASFHSVGVHSFEEEMAQANPEIIQSPSPVNDLPSPVPEELPTPVQEIPITSPIPETTVIPPLAPPQMGPSQPTVITPLEQEEEELIKVMPDVPHGQREISINFNNVAMIEYIRFVSRVTGKNFIFDESDLQFTVSIVFEEPSTIENMMAAMLQELKIRDLSLLEQGNSVIIHRNPRVRSPGIIQAEGLPGPTFKTAIVTRVFKLNTLDPNRAGEIIRPLLSEDALVEVLRDSNSLIITDLVANTDKISQLLSTLDAPNSGMTVGQYVVRNAFVDSLAVLAERILQPIAQGNPFVFVPHSSTNSIFVVSNPYIVERALGILENLDINEGKTKIFTLDQLKLRQQEEAIEEASRQTPGVPLTSEGEIPEGLGTVKDEEFGAGELVPGIITSTPRWNEDLPVGHLERTLFFIYKLKYRRGDQLEIALRKIAFSLQAAGLTNADLIAAIDSSQWIQSTNSLIFTGTGSALDRIKELIEEIDIPLRQVFIELLVLDATIADSLRYGVEWGTRFGGGNQAGSQAFLNTPLSPLIAGLDTGDAVNLDKCGPTVPGPDASGLARTEGYSLGVIGKNLTRDGTRFNTIGALVTAIHNDSKENILFNPKIITEDNHTSEIFVGSTDRYKTQSIANEFGNLVTSNYAFIDVGTTFRVTPLIGSNDTITLDIVQEITSLNPLANFTPASTNLTDVNLVPVLNKNRTLTRVHVPNGYFVVLSGMIQDAKIRTVQQIPCLGAIPLIGGGNKHKVVRDDKRNLMLFIRPLIVDTEEELEHITKRQQDVYREKVKFNRSWNYQVDEALDFLNIKPTDPDEIGCTVK